MLPTGSTEASGETTLQVTFSNLLNPVSFCSILIHLLRACSEHMFVQNTLVAESVSRDPVQDMGSEARLLEEV